MRDRRHLSGRGRDKKEEAEALLNMPEETEAEREARLARRIKASQRRGFLYYLAFLAIFLGVPLFIIARATPFFVVERLRCRAADKLLGDDDVNRMEAGYARYFSEPPLYLSDAFNRSVFWGTYDPSRIFAMTNRAGRPVTVGLAWHDDDGARPLRHVMPYVHNKVASPRSSTKRNRDPEVMQITWVTHDGLHYGKQIIQDAGNRVEFEVEFLKGPSGNSWHVRIEGRVESATPLHVVLYVLNGDGAEPVVVEPPAPGDSNDGDWTPVLQGRMEGHTGAKEPFTLRVFDRHNPLYGTAPWRIYGAHVDADDAFALASEEVVGGTVEERAAAGGRGIVSGARAAELRQQNFDLRDLPSSVFPYITTEDPASFLKPSRGADAAHNLVVMKKAYTADFRLEVSLSSAVEKQSQAGLAAAGGPLGIIVPNYDALSSCQLTNSFRRREKAIQAHARKIFRPFAHKQFNATGGLYERLASRTIAETFASLSFRKGRYLAVADPAVDVAWDQRGRAAPLSSADLVRPSTHVAAAVAAIGSRTDEAVGQQWLTGLEMLFFNRWNKEMVKDVLASWLVGAQDPATGFIPSRATFTATAQSLAPRELRIEHPTISSPPAVVLALQELLNEMERKGDRIRRKQQQQQRGGWLPGGGRGGSGRKGPKVRNTAAYYDQERAADREFLELVLPALRRWRAWWHETQCGGATEELARACSSSPRRPLEEWPSRPTPGVPADQLVYRWRSRDGHRIRASGMEDYPRPICEGEHFMEAHVDLFSWIALLSSVISRIEVMHLGHAAPSVAVDWEAHLDALHWDAAGQRYADRVGCVSRAFSPYVGYVNLYPVMLGVVRRDLSKARATIALAQRELLTDHGVMSVSFASVKRAREEGLPHSNMWMGFVWPSANLILLHAVKTTYLDLLGHDEATKTELEAFYRQLRAAQTETLRYGRRWWEFYNPVNGDGEGSKTYIGTQSLMLGTLYDFS